jgi:diaminopimelate epimerase
MSNRTISFRKMNGLGNDFAVFDARAGGFVPGADESRRIADRNRGVGCDQVIVLTPSADEEADAFMRIINADGSEVSACGNATRCVASLLAAETGRQEVTIKTRAGLLRASVAEDGTISADMGVPRFGWEDIPLSQRFDDARVIDLNLGPLAKPSVVNVGNPHCIFWVSDADAYDLATLGAALEVHPMFPERANISLAQVIGTDALKLRVWERGAGLTRACGTGACAAAVASARKGLTGRVVTVSLPGGGLLIEWRECDNHIIMTGPAELEYEGSLDLDTFEFDVLATPTTRTGAPMR